MDHTTKKQPEGLVRAIRPPSKSQLLVIRFIATIGVLSIVQFLWWFLDLKHIGNPWLFGLLVFAIFFKLARVIFEWFYYTHLEVPVPPDQYQPRTVDMLTTYVPGEPYEMIEETLRAMVNVEYPHTTILCDEGNDPYLKKFCEQLGVIHVYRGEDKTDAKAGNINYALKNVAKGEIAIILDPDHIPIPEFIDRVIPYFEDKEVGYVQCIQAYHNRNESFIAKAAAEQTYMFYGPMMMGSQHHGTTQAIGANCAFRRAALDDIGGHAPGLCEDMHTSMLIHSKKWKSVYIPEMLSRGLVPATLSSYYKQQLKWSRGSFELLFKVVPKIFRKVIWQQKLHYAIAPLYYLFGLIGLIDILVPIISLLTFEVPVFIEIQDFLFRISPVLISSVLMRQYVQRFVLDEHEQGFHFLGGTLRVSTWWIYLLGFIYSLLKIKVPYIPTPKGDEKQNEWRLSIPNIIVVLLSIFAIIYGLNKDWNPYSWMMAGFAVVNVLLLSLIIIISQQKLIAKFYFQLYDGRFKPYRRFWYHFRHNLFYKLSRNSISVTLFIVTTISLPIYHFISEHHSNLDSIKYPIIKQQQQFIMGYESSPEEVFEVQDNEFHLEVFNPSNLKYLQTRKVELSWGDSLIYQKLDQYLQLASSQSFVPYITIAINLPDNYTKSNPITPFYDKEDSLKIETILEIFNNQQYFKHVVFLSFAPQNYDIALKKTTWAYTSNIVRDLVTSSRDVGLSNLVWVEELTINSLNYQSILPLGSMDYLNIPLSIYLDKSYQYLASKYHVPIIISGIEIDNIPEYVDQLMGDEVQDYTNRWVVRGFIGMNEEEDYQQTPVLYQDTSMNYSTNSASVNTKHFQRKDTSIILSNYFLHNISYDSHSQQFTLISDEDSFYIKGIAYNPEHDWRDGVWPLTSKQLDADFTKIKEMGANTIRRYSPSVYDRNIFTKAEEHGLKVMYGFWFDPEVDYFSDENAKNAYVKQVLRYVNNYKAESSILAWVVGNETWGLGKHYFHKPYLNQVRRSYIEMVNEISALIHEIDPTRPVITAIETTNELPSALREFSEYAPALDAIGINVYYKEYLNSLDSIVNQFYPSKPYIISEFGPKGYWNEYYSDYNEDGRYLEQSSFEKARYYRTNWTNYVAAYQGHNLGGVAYAWRDRMEGTSTWYGITDYHGNIKPAYYALKNLWTNSKDTFPISDIYLSPKYFVKKNLREVSFLSITHDNENTQLNYEWYLKEHEYLHVLDRFQIKLSDSEDLLYKIRRQYYRRTLHNIYPNDNGRSINIILPRRKYNNLRIYLHVSDDQGHVITNSYPIN